MGKSLGVITRKPHGSGELEIPSSEADQILEMLRWSNFLCLRTLWNINAMKWAARLERVAKWIVHHHIGLPDHLRSEEKATMLAGPVVTVLALFGLISIKSVIRDKLTTSRSKGKKRQRERRSRAFLVAVPEIRSLTIFGEEQSEKITSLSTFKEACKDLACAPRENLKIVFPAPRVVQKKELAATYFHG